MASALARTLPLALILLATGHSAQRALTGDLYELTVLDTATTTRVGSVSVPGRVAGVRTAGTQTRAFVWNTGAGEVLRQPLAGFPQSLGVGMNAAGILVGTSYSPALTAATLWSPSGTALLIPDLGWSISVPIAINAAGIVVGQGLDGSGWHPWSWDATNGTRDLVALGLPVGSTVTGINASGVLAATPFFGEAFLFKLASATSTLLGTLGGDSSSARAINDRGHAAGWSWTAVSNEHVPFHWSPGTGMRALAPVVGDAHALNDDDIVVGQFNAGLSGAHAFVWDARSGFHDLNDLVRRRGGVELESANSISASGWIAGNGRDQANGGKLVGFVLRPR